MPLNHAVLAVSGVFFLAMFLATPASAQSIYKCLGADGRELYQNSPCPAGSKASVFVQTNGQPSAAEPSGPEAPRARTEAPRPQELPAPSAEPTPSVPEPAEPPATAVSQVTPSVGMSRAEVRAIWGEPREISQEEGVEGRVDKWSYDASRSAEFLSGRLSVVHP